VIQISFFSILQFEKIPPTFVGLKNLIFSNGYNDPNMFSSSQSREIQSVFTLMGIKLNALSNFNLSLVLLVIIPAVIGLTGVIFAKIKYRNQNVEEDVDDLEQISIKYEPLNNSKNSNGNENYVNSRLKAMLGKLHETI
jgi:hypothetical protein